MTDLLTPLEEKAERGECLKCGGNRWRVERLIEGHQTLTKVSIKIDPGWGCTDIWDIFGNDEIDVEDSTNETFTCENCGYELNNYDYDSPATEAATHARSL